MKKLAVVVSLLFLRRFLFLIAPVISLAPAFAAWAVVPFNDFLVLSDVDAGLLSSRIHSPSSVISAKPTFSDHAQVLPGKTK